MSVYSSDCSQTVSRRLTVSDSDAVMMDVLDIKLTEDDDEALIVQEKPKSKAQYSNS